MVTQTDETEKDDAIQTDKIGSTDEAEDAFLRDVIKDLCRGDREDIRVSETNEGVSQEKAFVKIYVLEENTLCRVKSSKGVLKHCSCAILYQY